MSETAINAHLAKLPEDRQQALSALRQTILEHLQPGFEEVLQGSMIVYQVPLSRYPNTYNKQPLHFAALASQKNHFALYLTSAYGSGQALQDLKDGFAKAGKKLDMGKSCLRFKKLDDVPLEVIGAHVQSVSVDWLLEMYEKARSE